jgi:glycosyltransferase involved in cell wall biosynthesis
MPSVWAKRPSVRLTIVGKDPSAEVLALARSHPGRVHVTGSVPDLAAYLRNASVAVVPIVYGAGVQNKVLEAMATCTPVVASQTAVAALDESVSQAMRIARDDGAFAAHVLSLLENEAERRSCGAAGRAFVERHHSWDASAAALETLYAMGR